MKTLIRSIPNALSLLRLLLSFCFISKSPELRLAAIAGAVITDVLDGYLARKLSVSTQLGAVLDPIADKVFVSAAIIALMSESSLSWGETFSMLSRDLALGVFFLYLLWGGRWTTYRIRAFIMGKVCTTMQFAALFFTALQRSLPGGFFSLLCVFGCLGFFELLFRDSDSVTP